MCWESKGRFGTVYRCQCKESGNEFAGKFIRKVGLRRVKQEEIRREVDIMNAVRSRRVVSLRDGFETAEFVVFMLDLATGGELFDYLAEKDALTEDEAAKFTRHILEGIDCMHEKNIVHLDLKPENIMLKDKNRSKVVIIDLGLARDLNKGEVKDICGTPEFVAPEVLNFDPVTLATDMWTVGVIVYIMLSGCSPFLGDDDNETMANVCNGDYEFFEEYFSEVSTGAKDFIKKLLRFRPQDRSTAYQSLMHPWIKPKRGQRSRSRIDTARLKRFNARQKWQATMEAVKLSLKMRISIGSVSSWMNSHPSCSSLSLDSQSSMNEDLEPSVDKSGISSEYSDSVFASPARQTAQQNVGGSVNSCSMCGSISSVYDTDDEVTSVYSKSDAMTKVHQLIESRNLKPSSSQSETSLLSGDVTKEHSSVGHPLLNSSIKRQRKVGTGFSPLFPHSTSKSLPGKEQTAAFSERVDDEDLMSGVVASLKQEVKARLREGEKQTNSKCSKLDNFQCDDNPDSHGNQTSSPRNMKNEATVSTGQNHIDVVRPDSDVRTEPDIVEKSESKVQKLRNTIMKWRRSSVSDGGKINGKRKGLDLVCAESDDKEKADVIVASPEEPVQKKKRKKVIRVVKKVVKKRKKVPKQASKPATDVSDDVASVDPLKQEKQKVSTTKKEGLSKFLRRFSFSRSKSSCPVVAENHYVDKQEDQLDAAEVEKLDVSGCVNVENDACDAVDEPLAETVLKLDYVQSCLPSNANNTESTEKQPQCDLPDLTQDIQKHSSPAEETTGVSTEQPANVADTHHIHYNKLPGEQSAEDEHQVTVDPVEKDVGEVRVQEVMTIGPAENALLENHGCEEKEETVCNMVTDIIEDKVESNPTVGVKNHSATRSDITVNRRSPVPYTSQCNEVKVEETPQQHSAHNRAVSRFSRWESEKKVSVFERVQMYQGQKNADVENVRKPAHSSRHPNIRSESVTNLRVKYESAAAKPNSGSFNMELCQEKAVKSRTLGRCDVGVSGSKSVTEGLSNIGNGRASLKLGVNSVDRSPSLNCLYSHSKVSPSSGGLSSLVHRFESKSPGTTPDTTPEPEIVSPKVGIRHRLYRSRSDSTPEPETNSQGLKFRREKRSPLMTSDVTAEPELLSPVHKVRQIWMSREESEVPDDKSKVLDNKPPPKIQLRDSWQKPETKRQPKELNKVSSLEGSVLFSKARSPVASQNQGWYKKHTRDTQKDTAEKVGVGNNLSLVGSKQPSESVNNKGLAEKVRIDSPSSCETKEIQNRTAGHRQKSEEKVSCKGSVAPTSTSSQVRVGNLGRLPDRQSSVTVQQSLISPMVSEKNAVKVAPRDVTARVVRLNGTNGTNHNHVIPCGTTALRSEFRQAPTESGNVTRPHITVNKQSLSSGKSGSKITMTFSVQKP
ncbi:uncharacterized protein LOC134186370 isoform X2 [Corticium candelabrum]|uniref:uncharacterized protein LOC134186370 isoform X2 n=1 Tax=Corticium candelabrum TaxID=121492 RepID=UPI002E257AA7|nr:uncharacterized protein LOC134186370 isoform X2 [Corticium candelabrum]